ncbi:hypothetical protein D3C84_746930 [compost metagenome]
MFDGLRAIPAFGHAHVDEGQGVRTVLLHRPFELAQPFLPAIRRVQLEQGAGGFYFTAEQRRFHLVQFAGQYRCRHEYLAKIHMDGRCIVDQQNAPV